ncbi:hypothetical protein BLNAU_2567 [Blattamonas nauphoetae]|uniref:Uncharacterized protein n=1 Tax=Blattamonas nauphoetae TaxID=2049346 RepID=A0ABQ9YEW6_9EUKA|nr:hypothetical protein BLNAU_2567 [Blattamonas nauphoetae]
MLIMDDDRINLENTPLVKQPKESPPKVNVTPKPQSVTLTPTIVRPTPLPVLPSHPSPHNSNTPLPASFLSIPDTISRVVPNIRPSPEKIVQKTAQSRREKNPNRPPKNRQRTPKNRQKSRSPLPTQTLLPVNTESGPGSLDFALHFLSSESSLKPNTNSSALTIQRPHMESKHKSLNPDLDAFNQERLNKILSGNRFLDVTLPNQPPDTPLQANTEYQTSSKDPTENKPIEKLKRDKPTPTPKEDIRRQKGVQKLRERITINPKTKKKQIVLPVQSDEFIPLVMNDSVNDSQKQVQLQSVPPSVSPPNGSFFSLLPTLVPPKQKTEKTFPFSTPPTSVFARTRNPQPSVFSSPPAPKGQDTQLQHVPFGSSFLVLPSSTTTTVTFTENIPNQQVSKPEHTSAYVHNLEQEISMLKSQLQGLVEDVQQLRNQSSRKPDAG